MCRRSRLRLSTAVRVLVMFVYTTNDSGGHWLLLKYAGGKFRRSRPVPFGLEGWGIGCWCRIALQRQVVHAFL